MLLKLLAYFLIFSFLGWIVEVVFHVVKTGKFVNRGFNNGPVCPIYGFGIVLIYLTLDSLRDTWVLLFAASVFLTTALEFLTGFLLDRVFHTKWWDYSDCRFNIGGYVCLRFSLAWGVLCMLVVKLLFPPLDALYALIPTGFISAVSLTCLAVLIADSAVSTASVIGLNRQLALLDKIADALHSGSDKLGRTVTTGTLKLEEQYREFQAKTIRLRRRLLDAFPTMRSFRYNEQLSALKRRLSEEREKIREFKRRAGVKKNRKQK